MDLFPIRRVILLALLVVCLGGTWTLEQPGNSFLEFFPTWQWFVNMLSSVAGGAETVFRLHISHQLSGWLSLLEPPPPKHGQGANHAPTNVGSVEAFALSVGGNVRPYIHMPFHQIVNLGEVQPGLTFMEMLSSNSISDWGPQRVGLVLPPFEKQT